MSNRTTRKRKARGEPATKAQRDAAARASRDEAVAALDAAMVTPDAQAAPSAVIGATITARGEVGDVGTLSLNDACDLMDKWFPLETGPEKARRAVELMRRDPLIRKAYQAGLQIGRDLRERTQHGRGWMWPELEPLTPKERGFVMARVKDAIMPRVSA